MTTEQLDRAGFEGLQVRADYAPDEQTADAETAVFITRKWAPERGR